MKLEQSPEERVITVVSRWRNLGFLPSESLVEAVRLSTGSEPIDSKERTFVEKVCQDLSRRS